MCVASKDRAEEIGLGDEDSALVPVAVCVESRIQVDPERKGTNRAQMEGYTGSIGPPPDLRHASDAPSPAAGRTCVLRRGDLISIRRLRGIAWNFSSPVAADLRICDVSGNSDARGVAVFIEIRRGLEMGRAGDCYWAN